MLLREQFFSSGGRGFTTAYGYAKENATDNNITDILVAIAVRNNGRGAAIGGFINPLDLAPIGATDEKINHLEGKIFSQYANKKELLTPQEYYSPDFYTQLEKDNKFTVPAKETFDHSFIDAALRETKEESGWNLSKQDLMTPAGRIFFENEVYWTQITAVFSAYIGEIINGNMEDETRNILIKDYKSPGFDDIKEIQLISLTSMKVVNNTLVIGPLKVPMNAYKIEQLNYLMIDAVSYIIKKYYGFDLQTKKSIPYIAKFLNEPLNGQNIQHLIEGVNLLSKN